jgi:PAS domain S-box-containing protein
MWSSLQRRLALALGAVLVLLLLTVSVHWRNTVQVEATAGRVAHTREVLGAVEHVLRLSVDAETGLGGYIITGDEQWLVPLDKARQELPSALATLGDLTRDNLDQKQRVDELELLALENLQFRVRVTDLVRTQGFEATRVQLQPGEGKVRMEAIRSKAAHIRAVETNLLQQRELASKIADRGAQWTLGVLAALTIVIVVGTYILLRRSLRARLAAEQALRESEENLSITLGSIGDAVLATDTQGRITRMNPVAEHLTGWTLAEARGVAVGDVFRIINEQTRAPAVVPVDQALATGKVQGLANHTLLISRSGRECAIADSAAPIRRADGELVGVVLVFRDVTEQRQAELALRGLTETLDARVRERTAELRESEARLRNTLDNLIEGCQIIGFDWRYQYLNRAAAAHGRSSVEALLGRTMMEAYPGIEQTPLFAKLKRGMAERTTEQFENDFVYPDGSTGVFQLVIQPVQEGIFILSMDISARRQAEKLRLAAQHELERRVVERTEELRCATEELAAKNTQLEQANRLKSEFLANMSHELRTPLNAVIGFSDVLRSGLAGELTPRQREFATDINTSGAHLLALISDILDLSKIEAGSMSLDKEELAVVPLLESCLAVVRDKATARNLELRTEIDPGLGTIEGDTRKVKQIVYNLLANAVKFTDPGGRVNLGARKIDRARIDTLGMTSGRVLLAPSVADRSFLEIAVQDNGIGIAAADLTRLFEPFVQVDASMKRRHEGTGLGLALVRRLVDLHGGGLTVESSVGRGSRFTVWLPYRGVVQRSAEAAGTTRDPQAGALAEGEGLESA